MTIRCHRSVPGTFAILAVAFATAATASFDPERGIITGERWASGVPLGGIGCGKVEILTDGWFGNATYQHNWDRPTGPLRGAFAAIRVATPVSTTVRMLRAAREQEYRGVENIPEVKYAGFFPRAGVRFQDTEVPVRISLHAFSSLIPGNVEDSALPATMLEFRVTNFSAENADISLLLSWPNLLGYGGDKETAWDDLSGNFQESAEAGTLAGLRYATRSRWDGRRTNVEGEYFLGVEVGEDTRVERCVNWDAAADTVPFWTEFADSGRAPAPEAGTAREPAGAVVANFGVESGTSRVVRYVLAWRLPHHVTVHPRERMTGRLVSSAADVALAFDGDPATRWTTGHPMRAGEGFRVDWGEDRRVAAVRLDSAGSVTDYPRGIRVEWMGADGEVVETNELDEVVAEDRQRLGVLEIAAEAPVTARSLRLTQLGSSTTWFWSIHELELLGEDGTPVPLTGAAAEAFLQEVETYETVEDVGHYYSRRFESAADIASYFAVEADRLLADTRAWQDLLVQSNLPFWLKLKLVNSAFPLFSNTVLTRAGDFAVLESPVDMGGALGTMDQRMAAHAFYTQMFPSLDWSELMLFARCQQPDGRITHFNGNVHQAIGSAEVPYGITDWPDLSCSFVLQAAKLAKWTGDFASREEIRPHVYRALDWLIAADRDGDLIPEGGSTYDYETMPRGAFVYSANCMLAALQAGVYFARTERDAPRQRLYVDRYERTLESVRGSLWTGDRFIKWTAPKTGERVENSFVAAYAGDWMSRLCGFGGALPDDMVGPGVEDLLVRHLRAFPLVPPMEVTPDGEMATTACFILQHEPYLGCEAIYAGYVEDGLDVLHRVFQLAWEGNRSPWNQSLAYDAPVGRQGGLVSYMTAPATWHVLNALTGAGFNRPARMLRIQPRTSATLPELHVPIYFPDWWGWLDYAPDREMFRITVMKVFGDEEIVIDTVGTTDDAHRVGLRRPFRVEERKVLYLYSYVDKLGLPLEAREVTRPAPSTGRLGLGIPADEWTIDGFHEAGPERLAGFGQLAIDGRTTTRWSTRRGAQPGDWMTIDLGGIRTIAGVALDHGEWENDYPRGLRIEVSVDGKEWTEVASVDTDAVRASIEETRAVVGFAPVEARRIRLTQAGEADGWWSVAEAYVLEP